MNLEALTAQQLLAIREPERLFVRDASKVNGQFHDLAKLWHPDRRGSDEANAVFAHIRQLYEDAKQKLATDTWVIPGLLKLRDIDGKLMRIRYKKKHSFELGDFYVGDSIVAYVLRNDFADLFEGARRRIADLRYADEAMRKEIERYMPKVVKTFHTNDQCVMVVEKTPDLLLLRDVLDHFDGQIDPKHVAWILNTIYNLCCYFGWSKLTHNAINVNSFFISPLHHSGALLGGWWYATPVGDRLTALPKRAIEIAPPDVITTKTANARLDLEAVRAMGREILGDRYGMALLGRADIPQPVVDYLRGPSPGKALDDYATWSGTVLPASFGKRRFVKLDIATSDIYGKE